MMNRTPTGIRPRDVNGLYEARDYLTQHYRNPPKIPELARMVGLNQTKLKAGFREVTKLTIYGYITKCRMERAAEVVIGRFQHCQVDLQFARQSQCRKAIQIVRERGLTLGTDQPRLLEPRARWTLHHITLAAARRLTCSRCRTPDQRSLPYI